jgi:16S rRNA G966 N2-methylase RsmD
MAKPVRLFSRRSLGAERLKAIGRRKMEAPRAPVGAETGISIFDPVLCEMMYLWFSSVGSSVLDPFAGGSVRGIVAAVLGRRYCGIDLSAEQVEENRKQWVDISNRLGNNAHPDPEWIVGDSAKMNDCLDRDRQFDFIFSCPPYGNLEVYSDNPNDLSTMTWQKFLDAYGRIISLSCERLRQDRFACFVVGDFRSPSGELRSFPSETILAFKAAGLSFWNDAVLLTAVCSLPIRVRAGMEKSRKLGRAHQSVLIFLKGDSQRAMKFLGPIRVEHLQLNAKKDWIP